MNKQEIIASILNNTLCDFEDESGTYYRQDSVYWIMKKLADQLLTEGQLTVREVVEWMQSNKVKSTNLHHDKGGVYYTNTVTCFESIEELTKIIRKEHNDQLSDNKVTEGYWWCPECKEEVDSIRVTHQELHDTCGRHVEWKEPQKNSLIK